jgi:protein subunit release factor A
MIEVQTRMGTGGEDARLLAKDLMGAYTKFASKKGIEIIDMQETKNSFSLYL